MLAPTSPKIGWMCVFGMENQMKSIDVFRSDNTIEGIESLIKKCKQAALGNELWCCFEHTGNYGFLLAELLEQGGVVYSAVAALEIKRSIGMTRGKEDHID